MQPKAWASRSRLSTASRTFPRKSPGDAAIGPRASAGTTVQPQQVVDKVADMQKKNRKSGGRSAGAGTGAVSLHNVPAHGRGRA